MWIMPNQIQPGNKESRTPQMTQAIFSDFPQKTMKGKERDYRDKHIEVVKIFSTTKTSTFI